MNVIPIQRSERRRSSRPMAHTASCIVTLLETRRTVFRPGEQELRPLEPGRRPGRAVGADDEIGREERPEEHDLRCDPQLDAEEHVAPGGNGVLA